MSGKKVKYDFYFVMGPIPIKYPSGGIKIIYAVAEGLQKAGYKVALQFLGNPWKYAKKVYPDKSIIEWSLWGYLTKNALNNKLAFSLLIPLIRKGLHINYKDHFDGLDLFFSNYFPKSVSPKNCIATDYITAFFVNEQSNCEQKFFISQHDESDPTYLSRLSWLAEKSYELPLRLIVINQNMIDKYKNKAPILFHVGISNSFFQSTSELKISKKPDTILLPLRTGKLKGAIYGIGAAELIHSKFHDLKIMAFGNYDRRKVPKFIDYYFQPDDIQILKLYKEADIFILPSLLEGMSLPPLEAMANYCVVVSADCVGIRVYMKHEENCLIVDKADSRAIFLSVSRLIADTNLRERLAVNGLETAKKYTYSNMVKEFLSIMK